MLPIGRLIGWRPKMNKLYRLILICILVMSMGFSFTSCSPTISVVIHPDGAGSVSPAAGTYQNGVIVNVVAVPNAGYRFDHWEGGVSGTSANISLNMNGSKKLQAYFQKTYTLTISPTSGGTVSPNSGTYDEGKNVTLIATPNQGYIFNGWGQDASGTTDHLTLVMNSNKTIVASFIKAKYTLQTQVDQNSGGSVEAGGSFDYGTQKSILATPLAGYRFNYWGGSAIDSNNPITVTMDSNKSITAFFIKQYNLTVQANPAAGGSVTPTTGIYDVGFSVKLSATSNFPYVLKNWTGLDGTNANPINVTMNSDKSITANFVQAQPVTAQPVNSSGPVSTANTVSIAVELQQNDWMQGELSMATFPGDAHITIKDPNGVSLKDYGPGPNTFSIFASIPGKYNIVFSNPNWMYNSGYNLTYTIYRIP